MRGQAHIQQDAMRALPWFLAHGALNSFFALWTFGGSVFLFFLAELGLPKHQIGGLLSLFPFCGILALGFAPLATRWGWKRVFLIGYGTRKLVMALLLLLPWVLSVSGQATALIFLFVVIIVFALLRALAETAYYPWSQEFIPAPMWGKVTGIGTMLTTLASGAALGIAGWVIGHGTGLSRFLVLIAAGCVLGILGVACMTKVPGGAPRPNSPAGMHGQNMAQALRDRNFLVYLGGSGCMTIGTLFFSSFLPLYVREQQGVLSGTVVVLDVLVMAGGASAGFLLGWAADRVGSRPVLMPCAALAVMVPVGWLLLPRGLPHAVNWCVALYFLNGVSGGGLAIAGSRLLFNGVIPPQHSTAYTAIYYAWLGITGGVAPLVAGAVLTVCGDRQTRLGFLAIDGHGLIFLGAIVILAAGWWLYGQVKPDDRYTTRTVLGSILVPSLLRLLAPRENPADDGTGS